MTNERESVTIKKMKKESERTALLLGEDGVEKLNRSRVAVFGIGGVGGYCAEALARAGVGEILLVDGDQVEESNLNRQIVALHSTIGQPKAEIMARRIADINPDCRVVARVCFYGERTADDFDFSAYDYVFDAVDDVAAKVEIISRAVAAKTPVISAMGAGNKLFPEQFEAADISRTQVCPLARIVRKKLRERGIERGVKVVYSKEPPVSRRDGRDGQDEGNGQSKQNIDGRAGERAPAVGSVSFVPSVMGLIMAGEGIKDLARGEK